VLISPFSIEKADWQAEEVQLSVTRQQVEESPSIDTAQPVSRQQEAAHFTYYGYPYYWHGTGLWGPAAYPIGFPAATAADIQGVRRQPTGPESDAQGDQHLRSSREVIGYHLQAADGELGHVDDFLVDDRDWAIRYMVVDTSNWWLGKKVLVSPEWITEVSWLDRKVAVDLTRQSVKQAPEFDSDHVDRQWEVDYHASLHRAPYWSRADAEPPRRPGAR
jgi:hypothetical protein